MIEADLITFLKATSAVTNLLGDGAGGVWRNQPEQNSKFPRISIRTMSGELTYSDAGEAGPHVANINVECQHDQLETTAEAVRDAVRTAVSGKRQQMGSSDVTCFVTDWFDNPYPAIHGDEGGVKAKVLSLELHFN